MEVQHSVHVRSGREGSPDRRARAAADRDDHGRDGRQRAQSAIHQLPHSEQSERFAAGGREAEGGGEDEAADGGHGSGRTVLCSAGIKGFQGDVSTCSFVLFAFVLSNT